MSTETTDLHRRLSDPQAEAAVLGSLLVDPHERDAVDDVFQILTPNDFDDKRHERIFRSIRMVWDRGIGIDFITVADNLDNSGELEASGGRDYIMSLAERVPTSTNLNRHASIVRDRAIRRDLNRVGSEIIELAKNPAPDERDGAINSLVDLAEKKVFEIADREQAGKGILIRDALKGRWNATKSCAIALFATRGSSRASTTSMTSRPASIPDNW